LLPFGPSLLLLRPTRKPTQRPPYASRSLLEPAGASCLFPPPSSAAPRPSILAGGREAAAHACQVFSMWPRKALGSKQPAGYYVRCSDPRIDPRSCDYSHCPQYLPGGPPLRASGPHRPSISQGSHFQESKSPKAHGLQGADPASRDDGTRLALLGGLCTRW
jgi:hypothetical protein